MLTKDLIAALQKVDPSGGLHVSIGNRDVHFVDTEPCYYDGCQQVLERDLGNEHYNIIGAEFRSGGTKVVIHDLSIWDAINNNPELPMKYDGDYAREHYETRVEAARRGAAEP